MDSTFQSSVPILIFSPLVGFLILALLGGIGLKKLGRESANRIFGGIAILAVFVPFAVTVKLALSYSAIGMPQVVTLAPWIDLGSIRVPFEFLIDPLSLTMMLVITGVGTLIHLYSIGYMAKDKEFTRFFTYMNLFITAMSILVLANNLVLLFVGWEGVGLCSYLLIGFWHKDQENVKAANKAFIVNRIGDFGFMLGMFVLFCLVASQSHGHSRLLSFDVLRSSIQLFHSNPVMVTTIGLLLFVGACGKSAQFPLYFWLPDAMAGPTPVSALIHAATMVTAGVFLLNRLSFLYAFSPVAGAVITMVGGFTALFAAMIALGQTDIKKVLAFSTISQLGFMFVACGAGGFSAGLFHVVTHSFFKALLFLGAGAVIHAMAHNQDMRNYGKLAKYLPVTCITMFVAFLAISGIPPFAGYYSKEQILGSAIGGHFAHGGGVNFGVIAGYTALVAAVLTSLYMLRLTWLTFFGREERWRRIVPEAHHSQEPLTAIERIESDPFGFYFLETPSSDKEAHELLGPDHTPHEVPWTMSLPLIILGIASVAGGFLLTNHLPQWLGTQASIAVPKQTEVPWLTTAGVSAAGLGLLVGLAMYFKGLPKREGWDMQLWSPLRRLAYRQFFYDTAVSDGSSMSARDIALFAKNGFEKWVVVGGLGGILYGLTLCGNFFRKSQTGYARLYAVVVFCGVLGLLSWIFISFKGGM